MNFKLAELLLRRKELADKLKVASAIKSAPLYEQKMVRKAINDTIDDVMLTIPKLTLAQVTAEFDWYSHQLRLTDAAIQQANWTTVVELPEDVMASYPIATDAVMLSTQPQAKK